MNCQEAILRLPWWLNGSLEPAERREVKDHLAGCASCREALAETRLAWEIFDQHIPTADLVAYASAGEGGEPDGSDRIDPALLERHLADCPECRAELEMVRYSRLLTEHDDVPIITDRTPVPAPPVKMRRDRGWQAAALAAGLTGIIAIGGWVGSVQKLHRMERAQAPVHEAAAGSANTPASVSFHAISAQLSPDALVRGAGNAGSLPLTVHQPKSGEVTLLLNSPTDVAGEHAYKLLDAAGKELVSGKIESDSLPAYVVTVDARLLPPGRYTIQLYVPGPNAAHPANPAGMQSYLFTVQ